MKKHTSISMILRLLTNDCVSSCNYNLPEAIQDIEDGANIQRGVGIMAILLLGMATTYRAS